MDTLRLVGLRGPVRIGVLLEAGDLAADDVEDVAPLVAVLDTGLPDDKGGVPQ